MNLTPQRQAPKHKTLKLFILISLALTTALAVGGALYYMHIQQVKTQQTALIAAEKKREAAKIELEARLREQRKKRRAEIQSLFDTYINAFKSELVHKADAYKKSRRLLSDLSRPINYKNAAFAKETYDLFNESLAPSLREQASGIINLFDRYSKQIEDDLRHDDNQLKQLFLKEWNNVTQEQLDHYVDFFAAESKLIDAYDALITFYYTHSRRYTVNEESNQFVFFNPQDAEKARILLERIEALKQ
ncbi:MAG: hypothetical protein ACLFP8_02310 [Alphaproteobacteria bacterium]